MELLTRLKERVDDRKSMDSKQIESQLAEMGIPYIPISWTDEFLISENLQNYFAEVIAKFSHIKRKRGTESHSLNNRKLEWIKLNKEYPFLNLAQSQQLVINLMKENKYLSTLL